MLAQLSSPPGSADSNAAFREAWRALARELAAWPAQPSSDDQPVAISPREASTTAGALSALAGDGEPSADLLAQAPPILCDAYPRFPYLVLRAAHALAGVGGADEAPWRADAWLCLARIHAYRREGAQALEAVRETRSRLPSGRARADRAWCTLIEGQGLAFTGHYAEAGRLLAAARSAFRRLGDAEGQAETALALSHYHAELAHSTHAQAFAEEAVRLAGDRAWLSGRARAQLADLAVNRTRYAEAAEAYAGLAPLCLANGWRLDYAHVRLMQGILRTQQGAFAEAHGHLAAAIEVYSTEATAYYIAVCQRASSILFRGMGRYEEALTAAQAALRGFQALGHALAVGRCHHAAGMVYHSWNRHDEALVAYSEALAAYQAVGHRHGELVIEMNRALIHETRGHYHAALAAYEQGFAASRALRLTNLSGYFCRNMALLNGRLGRYDEAVALYRSARRYHKHNEDLIDAHICATCQAGILNSTGRRSQARRLVTEARRYFRGDQRPAPLAFCELTLGEIAAGDGRSPQALHHFQAALLYFDRSGQAIDAAICRLDMGEAYLANGQPDEAATVLGDALPRLEASFPDMAARAEHALGRAAHTSGQLRAAAAHWQAAVAHATIARRGIVTESHAGSFFQGRRRIYEDALDGWLAVGELGAALEVAETSKGQVLASLLQQRDVVGAAFLGQTPEVRALWEQAWQVGRELDALRGRWPTAEAGATRGLVGLTDAFKGPAGDAADRLASLADRQALLFERIRRSAISFDLLDSVTPFSVERLRARADATCGAGWGALAYYLRRDRVDIFWVTSRTVRSWSRSLSRLDLAKLRQAVAPDFEQRELLYAGRLRGEPQPLPPGRRVLRDLARLLIPEDVRDALVPDRSLLIAPHGLLHYLPFQALLLEDARPLLEHATVSYAPTLRVWEGLAERRSTMADRPAGQALICGLGEFGPRAPALAYAEGEAHDLAERFGPRGRLLLGPAVTHERLQTWSGDGTLAGFDVVHLATHASFDGAHPLQSRILLADAALTLPDLFRLRLNARLVTLSACQTALSALEPGDELLGLREALLFAGANSLLVSLWAVDDASTGKLMALFYERLLHGLAPAAALAYAQRQMRAAGESAFHWAPFVVIG